MNAAGTTPRSAGQTTTRSAHSVTERLQLGLSGVRFVSCIGIRPSENKPISFPWLEQKWHKGGEEKNRTSIPVSHFESQHGPERHRMLDDLQPRQHVDELR